MPTHAEQRHLPYSQKQLFELVAAVERYPEFLPWCTAARITKRSGNVFHADLVVRFKVFQERFVSKVTLHPHALIDVEYINGPFRYLNNHWRFIETDDGGCTIDFYVDFEFRSQGPAKADRAAVQRGGLAHGGRVRSRAPTSSMASASSRRSARRSRSGPRHQAPEGASGSAGPGSRSR